MGWLRLTTPDAKSVGTLLVALATIAGPGTAAAQTNAADHDRSGWTAITTESPPLYVVLPPGWTRVPGAAAIEAMTADGDQLSVGVEDGEDATGPASDRADTWRGSIEDAFGAAPDPVDVAAGSSTIVRLDSSLPTLTEPVRSTYLYDGCAEGGTVAVFRGTDPSHRTDWDAIAAGVDPCDTAPPATGPSASVPAAPPAFRTIALKGKGDKVARFKIPADQAAIAVVIARGSGNFAIWTVDASGNESDLLVNEIGSYKGSVLFDAEAGSHSVAFKITASGSWTVRVEPVSEARTWDTSKGLKGTGDDVVLLAPASSGLVSTDIRSTGSGNFAIWAYGDDTDLLVNEIGHYSGEVLLPEATLLLQITADGPWSMTALR